MKQISHLSPLESIYDSWQRPQSASYDVRALLACPVRIYLRAYHGLRIEGTENLPANGSYVMVANHTSHLDALCLLAALPLTRLSHTFAAAAQDYFGVGARRLAASIFVNAIPFSRRSHVRQSLSNCRRLLSDGENVLILFPEGTRSSGDGLKEFLPGVGGLVAGTRIPVVPCAIHGGFEAWPKGARFPRPRGLRVVIGRPRRYRDAPACRQSRHRIAAELHDAVEDLLCR